MAYVLCMLIQSFDGAYINHRRRAIRAEFRLQKKSEQVPCSGVAGAAERQHCKAMLVHFSCFLLHL